MEKNLVYVVFEDCSDDDYNEVMLGIFTNEQDAKNLVDEKMKNCWHPHFPVWFDEKMHDAYFYKAVELNQIID